MPVTINGTTGIVDADGGSVLSSADIASQAEAQTGTDNTKVVTPLRVAQATLGTRLSSSTLTNVTASRAMSTNYQNTTSSWRFVAVTTTNNGQALLMGPTSGGQSTVVSFNATNSTTFGLVPPGWFYSATGSVLSAWWESA